MKRIESVRLPFCRNNEERERSKLGLAQIYGLCYSQIILFVHMIFVYADWLFRQTFQHIYSGTDERYRHIFILFTISEQVNEQLYIQAEENVWEK